MSGALVDTQQRPAGERRVREEFELPDETSAILFAWTRSRGSKPGRRLRAEAFYLRAGDEADVPVSPELVVEQFRRERQIDEVFADIDDLGALMIVMEFLDRPN
jgi:hypothetical protein